MRTQDIVEQVLSAIERAVHCDGRHPRWRVAVTRSLVRGWEIELRSNWGNPLDSVTFSLSDARSTLTWQRELATQVQAALAELDARGWEDEPTRVDELARGTMAQLVEAGR